MHSCAADAQRLLDVIVIAIAEDTDRPVVLAACARTTYRRASGRWASPRKSSRRSGPCTQTHRKAEELFRAAEQCAEAGVFDEPRVPGNKTTTDHPRRDDHDALGHALSSHQGHQ